MVYYYGEKRAEVVFCILIFLITYALLPAQYLGKYILLMLKYQNIDNATRMIDLWSCQAGFKMMDKDTKSYILLVIGAIMMIPSFKMKFGYMKTVSLMVLPFLALNLLVFIIGCLMNDKLKMEDDSSDLAFCFNLHRQEYPLAIEIINLFPVFCYSFNFEVSILPVYASFNKVDKVGLLGVKTCLYTLLIAVVYYLIFVTFPLLLLSTYDNKPHYM